MLDFLSFPTALSFLTVSYPTTTTFPAATSYPGMLQNPVADTYVTALFYSAAAVQCHTLP